MYPLQKRYGKESRWVNWSLEKVKGKETKIPYSAKTGRKASSTDPDTWTTYALAKKAKATNIGIVLHDAKLICIDIDHILTNGKLDQKNPDKEKIAELLLSADTFTEVSQSGTGLHLFIELTDPLILTSNKKAPFEVYSTGRYIATTGISYGKKEREIAVMTPAQVLEIINLIIPQKEQKVGPAITPHDEIMSDKDILTKMFNSKNGKDIRALFDGDILAYKNDESSADMALCSHLAFWTAKNPQQIERIWLSSSLGKREKTQERQDYRTRTIENAIVNCKEVYTLPPHASKELDLLFIYDQKGNKVFVQNTENICRILRSHQEFIGRVRYDIFKNVYEIKPQQSNIWREIEDNDAVNLQTRISVLFTVFAKVGKEMVYDAVIKVAKENQIDSAVDFIKSLKWDGTARLDTWLTQVYGCPVDPYHTAVGANWIKGLVKRIVEPGCKFDYVLVLEGEQGVRKSTSLAILGGSWHVETTMSTDSKDFFMQFSGKAIIEFSEGETLSRTEVKRMKAIITMQSDKYRPPYERVSREFPRRCVFAMTTNQTEYLKDETGNRRWLPVSVVLPEANTDWLAEFRNQLFAEAYQRLTVSKETVYEFPKEETLAAQNMRRVSDPNADLIKDWFFNVLSADERNKGVTVHQVWKDVLHQGFTSKPLDNYNAMRIADLLKRDVGLIKRRVRANGTQVWRWFEDNALIETNVEAYKPEPVF